MNAMRSLYSLGLFPAVFDTGAASDQVGTSYGEAGVQLMEAAEQLLRDWEPQVRFPLLAPPLPHSKLGKSSLVEAVRDRVDHKRVRLAIRTPCALFPYFGRHQKVHAQLVSK